MTNESSPREGPDELPAGIINSITITDSIITRDPDSTHWMDNLPALPPCPLPDGDYTASVRDGV